jgi:hypothetical protein
VDLAQGNGTWNFGRTWNNQPITVYLNTTLDDNAAATLISSRWIEKGMNNTDPVLFGEYNTLDAAGNNITPASNIIHSHGGDFETIINAEQAAGFTYEMMFSENLEKQWNPAMLTRQLEAPANAKFENGVVSWTPANNGAIAYAIFLNDVFVGITEGSSFDLSGIDFIPGIESITIRAANAMGGFGPAAVVGTGSYEVTLSETGYATFYDSKTSYNIPTGLKAYVVSAATTESLTYTEVPKGIPAATAVMLKSDDGKGGTYVLTPTEEPLDVLMVDNLLCGSDKATTTWSDIEDCLFYKLTYGHINVASVFGWLWGADNGAPFTIEAHRAWLPIPKDKASALGYILEIDGETAINKVAADGQKGEYYNLKGQRVAAPTKGLYIINNKKVVIK